MSALTVTTRTSSHGSEPEYCACGEPLQTPYERRNDRCYECELTDQRMACAVCKEYVGIAYCDGRPTFSSDACEELDWRAWATRKRTS